MTATHYRSLDDANHFENELQGILKGAFDRLVSSSPESDEHRTALTIIETSQKKLHGFMNLRRKAHCRF